MGSGAFILLAAFVCDVDIGDEGRFYVDPKFTAKAWMEGRDHFDWVKKRWDVTDEFVYRCWKKFRIWDLIDDLNRMRFSSQTRLTKLAELRLLLGKDYETGKLPVPILGKWDDPANR